jgi:hypothetical protein
MASNEKCEKVCWWTKAGSVIDYLIPLSPSKNKKED